MKFLNIAVSSLVSLLLYHTRNNCNWLGYSKTSMEIFVLEVLQKIPYFLVTFDSESSENHNLKTTHCH